MCLPNIKYILVYDSKITIFLNYLKLQLFVGIFKGYWTPLAGTVGCAGASLHEIIIICLDHRLYCQNFSTYNLSHDHNFFSLGERRKGDQNKSLHRYKSLQVKILKTQRKPDIVSDFVSDL